jgi:hypothetical protein
MLRLHYYSNIVGLHLESIEEDDEVYSLDQIKEFEAVSRAWKEALAEHLLQGIANCLTGQLSKLLSGLLFKTEELALVVS